MPTGPLGEILKVVNCLKGPNSSYPSSNAWTERSIGIDAGEGEGLSWRGFAAAISNVSVDVEGVADVGARLVGAGRVDD